MRNRWWAAPLLAGGAAVLAACGSTASTSTTGTGGGAPATTTPSTTQQANGSGPMIKTASTSKGTVLVNAAGKTLYWFAIDTPTKSNCTSTTCVSFWAPVLGKASAAAGASLPKTFGTITRPDGKVQATYDGHPLYTFSGDSGPGSIKGNDFNASGGLWWAMTPSGAKLGASPAPSSSTSSAGGGYY
jgi:predicted lipoprotein with Yx(FWY)xxD motif